LPICINKGGQCLICSLTHSIIQSASLELQLEKKEEREAHYLGEDIL
jgi:hypothetical protein